MNVILVTGGARSGKSAYAQRRAWELAGGAVTVVVTAEPRDEEMALRIARHRAERPASWRTVECPERVGSALRLAETEVTVLDCLTLLVSNVLLRDTTSGEEAAVAAVAAEVKDMLDATAARSGTLIAVTNEVGLGVVPDTPIGRWFRDALGVANQQIARVANEIVLLVSGVPLQIKLTPQAAWRLPCAH